MVDKVSKCIAEDKETIPTRELLFAVGLFRADAVLKRQAFANSRVARNTDTTSRCSSAMQQRRNPHNRDEIHAAQCRSVLYGFVSKLTLQLKSVYITGERKQCHRVFYESYTGVPAEIHFCEAAEIKKKCKNVLV